MLASTEPSPPAAGGAATFAAMPGLGGDDVEEGAINDAAPGEDSAGDGSAGDDVDGDVANGYGSNSSAVPSGRPNLTCARSLGGDDNEEVAIPGSAPREGAIAIDDPTGATGDAAVDAPASDETNEEESNPFEELRRILHTAYVRGGPVADTAGDQ